MIQLIKGDCIEEMQKIEPGSVDLVLTDPPYGTVKGLELRNTRGNAYDWDIKIDTGDMFGAVSRVLRRNGMAVLFSQEPYTGELTTSASENITFSHRYVWNKQSFANFLSCNKVPVNFHEDICVFVKKYDGEQSHPLRSYAAEVFAFIAKSKKAIAEELGSGCCDHFFRFSSSQFDLCTEEAYNKLMLTFGIAHFRGFKDYSCLKAADNEHKKLTRRVFNLRGAKYKSSIIDIKKDPQHLHPTQKPVALMEDLIQTYTNEGDTVLDFTMGSGSTGVACVNTGRKFIGIERDEKYFNIAFDRIILGTH